MKLREAIFSRLAVDDVCPECGEGTGIDYGTTLRDEIPLWLEMECEDCELEWRYKFDLLALLTGKPLLRWIQDANSHWSCTLPGEHVLTVWSSLGIDWTWEVWPQDRDGEEVPGEEGNAESFEEAVDLAEQSARKLGLLA